jgi:hypothetical protein
MCIGIFVWRGLVMCRLGKIFKLSASLGFLSLLISFSSEIKGEISIFPFSKEIAGMGIPEKIVGAGTFEKIVGAVTFEKIADAVTFEEVGTEISEEVGTRIVSGKNGASPKAKFDVKISDEEFLIPAMQLYKNVKKSMSDVTRLAGSAIAKKKAPLVTQNITVNNNNNASNADSFFKWSTLGGTAIAAISGAACLICGAGKFINFCKSIFSLFHKETSNEGLGEALGAIETIAPALDTVGGEALVEALAPAPVAAPALNNERRNWWFTLGSGIVKLIPLLFNPIVINAVRNFYAGSSSPKGCSVSTKFPLYF